MNDQLQDVRRLESEFADAMNRMYAVGNGLARMRASLELGSTVPAPSAAAAPEPPRDGSRPLEFAFGRQTPPD